MANNRHTTLDQLKKLAVRTKTELDALKSLIEEVEVPEYSLVKQENAESGYLSTYYLTKNDEQVGAKINIPKDFLVKSAEIKTVETEDTPYEGAKVGDKYIDFVVNTKEGTDTEDHIYLPVNDLVDVYTEGDGIAISAANVVSIKIDTANANGLGVGANGLKLDLAVANDEHGENGKAGAMSAEDKTKLDSFEQATDLEVENMLAEVFDPEPQQGNGD